jgi:hypothetical protein
VNAETRRFGPAQNRKTDADFSLPARHTQGTTAGACRQVGQPIQTFNSVFYLENLILGRQRNALILVESALKGVENGPFLSL